MDSAGSRIWAGASFAGTAGGGDAMGKGLAAELGQPSASCFLAQQSSAEPVLRHSGQRGYF